MTYDFLSLVSIFLPRRKAHLVDRETIEEGHGRDESEGRH